MKNFGMVSKVFKNGSTVRLNFDSRGLLRYPVTVV